ncbi:transcriptional regulator [Candidatus Clostridium helianthi]|uniref:Transcriptional regulator n=1 Tax=Candidatus Clostridium helianthi TaxID=3381660 RepID=A0ABW8S1A6_9CLOT
MKYKQKFTPHELTKKTVSDIEKRRQLRKTGERQAKDHCFQNMEKIARKLSYGRY